MDEVIESVKAALAKYLSLAASSIDDDAELYENLGIDSSGIVSLLLDLEQNCSIAFDMEALQPEHLSTVSSLSALIRELQSIQKNEEV